MRPMKSALYMTMLVFAALTTVALACGTGMLTRDFSKNGWNFSISIVPIPDDQRAAAKATHQVFVVAINPKGESVTDGEVKLELMSGLRTISSGTSTFMAGKPMPCETMHEGMSSHEGDTESSEPMMCKHGEMMQGHYSFNVNIPEPGKYKIVLTVRQKEVTQKATTTVETY